MSGSDLLFNLLTVLRVLAPLFLLILLGAFLRRRGLLPPAAVPTLNAIVMNVTLPALVVLALAKASDIPPLYAAATFALFCVEVINVALAYGLGRLLRLPRPTVGALMMTGTIGNTGFLGYPIGLARPLIASIFPLLVLQDQFGTQLPMYLATPAIGGAFGGPSPAHPGVGHKGSEPGGRRKAMLQVFRRPIFISVILGLMLRLIPWPQGLRNDLTLGSIGGILAQTLTYLGQGTTPVVLLALGAALRPSAIRRTPLPVALACGLKLFVLPCLMWILCRAFGIHDIAPLSASVEQAAMPTGVISSVLCTQYAMEGDMAVGIVFTSTLLSAFTLPLVLSLLH